MIPRPECPAPPARTALAPAHGQEMTLEQAMAEAARCLSSHSCTGCELCQVFCPDLAITKAPATGRPVIDLKFCKGCGICAQVCPKGAITMVLDRPSAAAD